MEGVIMLLFLFFGFCVKDFWAAILLALIIGIPIGLVLMLLF